MKRRDFLKGILAGAAAVSAPRILAGLPPLLQKTFAELDDGNWHNITYTYDDGITKFYVDGERVLPDEKLVDAYVSFDNKKALIQLPADMKKDTQTVSFWAKKDAAKDNRYIDNLTVWDRNLTDKEMEKIRND